MYESFFGLQTEPFSVAPDPRFMYLSDVHREALRQLEIGLRGGAGFVVLTGEIGAGKTTVWRSFLEQLPPNFDVATVVNPKLGVDVLLARVCEDLGVTLPDGPARDPIDALHGHLLLAHAQGRRTLIVVDEAQALSDAVLEQLRLLTNLVTADRKLVQVLLIGQPELREMLERPVLEPVAQRVVARFHLPALPEEETRRYIAHRLAVAGALGLPPFEALALAHIHALCGGVPRRINVLCDRALLAAFEARVLRVTPELVDQAAQEVFARALPPKPAAEAAAPAPDTTPPPGPNAAAPAGAAGADHRGVWAVAGIALVAGLLVSPWLRSWLAGPEPARPTAAVAAPVPALAPAPAPVGVPASAAVAPALPSLSPLDVFASPGDEASAWRALASQWGATLPAVEPCAAAPGLGLQCYRGRGGLAAIRQLDRPALVTLTDPLGRSSTALLTAVSAQDVTLRVGDREQVLPLAALARDWRGEFGTLWRAPPGYREGMLITSEDGAISRWLAERLAPIDGGSRRPLDERIVAFQLTQGLAPDGLVGPQTLMQLNRAAGVDEPRLSRR
ncbi:MAG: AAA family ATPase [Rubrivivax sp.]|nr:AAA family ATPase [Rubrivivax sp.]